MLFRSKLDGHAVEVGWQEMFAAKAPYRQRYDLKGTLPTAVMVKAGLPSPEPFVTGPVGTTVRYQTLANGTGEVAAKLELKAATASVPPLGSSTTRDPTPARAHVREIARAYAADDGSPGAITVARTGA